MASELEAISAGWSSGISGAYNYTVWGIIILVIAGVIWFLWYYKSFNRIVNVKVFTNNSMYFIQDKAKETTIKGVPVWKFWNLKEHAPLPPYGSVYISNKGRRVAEAYYHKDMGIVWAADTTNVEKIQSKIKEAVDAGKNAAPGDARRIIEGSMQPLTSAERSMMADFTIRASKRRGQNLLETVIQIAAFAIPAMCFIALLIFWGDIVQPIKEIGQNVATVSQQNAIVSQQNAQILQFLYGGKIPMNITQTITGVAVGGGG